MNIKRKNLTLPSGAVCSVRPFTSIDLIGELGTIPNPLAEGSKESSSTEAVAFGFKMAKIALLHCCGSITSKGLRYTIVDKPFDLCGPREVIIQDLDEADVQVIVQEIFAISNMGKEAVEPAKTFPQEPRSQTCSSPNC